MSISMKWSLVSHESFDPNSESIGGFYNGDNFINDFSQSPVKKIKCLKLTK